ARARPGAPRADRPGERVRARLRRLDESRNAEAPDHVLGAPPRAQQPGDRGHGQAPASPGARRPLARGPGGNAARGGGADRGAPGGAEALNTVLVGALLGLSLGLVLAFVQETLDTSIGTIEDVEAYLEVPVLGVVPHIDSRETVQRILERRPALAQMDPEALLSHALLITHFDPKSPVAEAYRTLRTNVQFARMERSGKILVITSPTLQ